MYHNILSVDIQNITASQTQQQYTTLHIYALKKKGGVRSEYLGSITTTQPREEGKGRSGR